MSLVVSRLAARGRCGIDLNEGHSAAERRWDVVVNIGRRAKIHDYEVANKRLGE